MEVSRMPQEGDRFGNWIISRTLDKGGMGMVYLVRNPTLRVERALKVLDPEVARKDREFVARFNQEAALVCGMHSPNLVEVYDAGQDENSGFYYIVMEYLGGGTLRERMRARGPMPWREALTVVRQVALALSAVAKRNSVHRDIKPENIMFTADGVAKLADFGIAKASQDPADDTVDPVKTRCLQIFGTPAYMSPEQISDASKVDARADIWSLGVVLFEMLAGVRPYPAKDMMEAGKFLLSSEPFPDIRTFTAPTASTDGGQPTAVTMKTLPTMATQAVGDEAAACSSDVAEKTAVRETSPDVPEGVAALLLRMCDKDIDKRIATSEAVVVAIDELLGPSVPTEASSPPVPASEPAQLNAQPPRPDDRPLASRRRLLWFVIAALLGLVIVLFACAILQRRSAESKRQAPVELPPAQLPAPAVPKPSSNDSLKTNAACAEVDSPAPVRPQPAVDTNQAPVVRIPEQPRQPPTPTSQVVLFQPQGGSIVGVLSQLDGAVGRRPAHLRVSLTAYAQRKDLTLERYEQQLLIPVIERLRSSGVSFSLVTGTGKYGSVVQNVAKRFGCDLD